MLVGHHIIDFIDIVAVLPMEPSSFVDLKSFHHQLPERPSQERADPLSRDLQPPFARVRDQLPMV